MTDSLSRIEQLIFEYKKVSSTSFDKNAELWDLPQFIYSFDVHKCEADFKHYDRLCKKVDVPRVLYVAYSKNFSTSRSTDVLGQGEADAFALNLLYLCAKNHDLKFINTLLKMKTIKNLRPSAAVVDIIEDVRGEVFDKWK